MGFFDKSILGQFKDVVTKGPNGIFNEAAREQLPLANAMNNPDGTINQEAMAKVQQQSRDALAKAGNMKIFGKSVLAPDVAAGYQQMMEGAFQRQQVMMDMMNEHVQAKHAAAGESAVTASAAPATAASTSAAEGGTEPFARDKGPFGTEKGPFDR